MADLPNGLIGYWVRKTVRVMNNIYDHKLNKHGLTASQVLVLSQLWLNDGLTQKEIQENLNITSASVSGMVDTLCEKKLVVREHDSSDARIKRLYLTQQGKQVQDISNKIITEIEDGMSAGFSQDEVAIFICWIKKVYHNLDSYQCGHLTGKNN